MDVWGGVECNTVFGLLLQQSKLLALRKRPAPLIPSTRSKLSSRWRVGLLMRPIAEDQTKQCWSTGLSNAAARPCAASLNARASRHTDLR